MTGNALSSPDMNDFKGAPHDFAGRELAGLRILLTNDDGIHAPGLRVLEAIAREITEDVWVCAPDTEQSGASHSLTLHDPLRLRQHGERHFSVSGTPTDSVLLGVKQVLKDRAPDLIISGVNRGSNMGDDITYSGTIAAAMEGTLLNIPSLAFSQHDIDWSWQAEAAFFQVAEAWGARVLRKLLGATWPRDVLLNINFPDVEPDAVKGIFVVPHGRHKIGDNLTERHDLRGRPYYWIGADRSGEVPSPNTDIATVMGGGISVTPITINLNRADVLASLGGALA
jgi:5'-nucleotidase